MKKRIYDDLLQKQLENHRQMIFLTGPRQSGKTTVAKSLLASADRSLYFNWDLDTDRALILSGTQKIKEKAGLEFARSGKPLLCFDEIHKYKKWKNLIKGLFDSVEGQAHLIVTGSARLNVFRKGSDSLMGRYFLYHIHPLSVGEIAHHGKPWPEGQQFREPASISSQTWESFWEYGAFPEPFLKADKRFYRRWAKLRQEQLFREDLREITEVKDLHSLELLANLLSHQVGQLVNYSKLASVVGASVDTIKRWCAILEMAHYCYFIRPWTRNVKRSLIKEPKVYLWDYSLNVDPGFRFENMVSNHLLKHAHYLTDSGEGDYNLFFIRDKEKREVDFLLTENEKPFLLVEAKTLLSDPLSRNLIHFNHVLRPSHAFQIVRDAQYEQIDLRKIKAPIKIGARNLLSQLA